MQKEQIKNTTVARLLLYMVKEIQGKGQIDCLINVQFDFTPPSEAHYFNADSEIIVGRSFSDFKKQNAGIEDKEIKEALDYCLANRFLKFVSPCDWKYLALSEIGYAYWQQALQQ